MCCVLLRCVARAALRAALPGTALRCAALRSAALRCSAAQRILQRIETLEELPWAAPAWRAVSDESFRRLVVGQHVVLYRVADPEGVVYILAVRHGMQRPLDGDEVPDQ